MHPCLDTSSVRQLRASQSAAGCSPQLEASFHTIPFWNVLRRRGSWKYYTDIITYDPPERRRGHRRDWELVYTIHMTIQDCKLLQVIRRYEEVRVSAIARRREIDRLLECLQVVFASCVPLTSGGPTRATVAAGIAHVMQAVCSYAAQRTKICKNQLKMSKSKSNVRTSVTASERRRLVPNSLGNVESKS